MRVPVPGQRSSQSPHRAGMQSSGALGRSARAAGGLTEEMILQVKDGSWVRVVTVDGIETLTPYEMKEI